MAASVPLRVGIIGGSIGGLAAATAFSRLGASVVVFEKAASGFEGRGSSLGFCDVALWESLTERRMTRRGQRASRAQGAWFYGDLWNFLRQGLPEAAVRLGVHVTDLGTDPVRPVINGECFDLVVVADGGWSELRTKYFPDAGMPQYAGWQAWRFKVSLDQVPGFRDYGMYSSSDYDFYDTILLDVATDAGEDYVMGGTAIACPESEVRAPVAGENRQGGIDQSSSLPQWFLPFFRARFGQIHRGELYRAMEVASRLGKITPNAQYEYCAKHVVHGHIVLVGDAAHMAVPRTAAGAHTAVLDGMGLLQAFAPVLQGLNRSSRGHSSWSNAVEAGLAAYELPALQRARGLYERSLQTSAQVLPPAWTRESARTAVTPERAAAMTVQQLRGELAARRLFEEARSTEKPALVDALLAAVGKPREAVMATPAPRGVPEQRVGLAQRLAKLALS